MDFVCTKNILRLWFLIIIIIILMFWDFPGMEFAPYRYRTYICIYGKHKNLIINKEWLKSVIKQRLLD